MKAVDGVDPAHEGKEAVMADSADDAANGYANPTGQFTLFPLAPDLAGWLTAHGREALGGGPLGNGTPPDPRPPEETVPDAHIPLVA